MPDYANDLYLEKEVEMIDVENASPTTKYLVTSGILPTVGKRKVQPKPPLRTSLT